MSCCQQIERRELFRGAKSIGVDQRAQCVGGRFGRVVVSETPKCPKRSWVLLFASDWPWFAHPGPTPSGISRSMQDCDPWRCQSSPYGWSYGHGRVIGAPRVLLIVTIGLA